MSIYRIIGTNYNSIYEIPNIDGDGYMESPYYWFEQCLSYNNYRVDSYTTYNHTKNWYRLYLMSGETYTFIQTNYNYSNLMLWFLNDEFKLLDNSGDKKLTVTVDDTNWYYLVCGGYVEQNMNVFDYTVGSYGRCSVNIDKLPMRVGYVDKNGFDKFGFLEKKDFLSDFGMNV